MHNQHSEKRKCIANEKTLNCKSIADFHLRLVSKVDQLGEHEDIRCSVFVDFIATNNSRLLIDIKNHSNEDFGKRWRRIAKVGYHIPVTPYCLPLTGKRWIIVVRTTILALNESINKQIHIEKCRTIPGYTYAIVWIQYGMVPYRRALRLTC